jgi:hypothetical protein
VNNTEKGIFSIQKFVIQELVFDSKQMTDETQVAAVSCCGVATITARIIRLVRETAKSDC